MAGQPSADSSRGSHFSRCSIVSPFLLKILAITVALGGVTLAGPSAAVANKVDYPFPQRFRVPDSLLDGGTEWLNTSGDIHLKDLRGKIVLLDFWTYCCINCLHVLPDLKYLEEKYPDELVVIGVHSAKFENEKESENIRNAVMRYNIEHPVVNDSNMVIWRKVGIRGWPSFLVIDAEGHACFLISGEGRREILDEVISKLIKYHKANGTLDQTPIRFDLERDKLPPTPLKFPGKVLADEENGRLFISDTNHNRIVVTSLEGELLEIIGNGAIGADDGTYDEATFDHPQGMTLVDDTLYVADTDNHLLRTVDLKQKVVSTLAGTGRQARTRADRGRLGTTALNSPWALTHLDGTLYIAMAGPHQVWRHRLGTNTISLFAGSGVEDILDGPLKEAALAQPSGITTDGRFLYLVDSEGSAIRRLSVGRKGEVTTVVGPSGLPMARSLFEFGDQDGVGSEVRMQHPLGIVYHDGVLYVADAYNHKIKKVLPGKPEGRATTWLGDGEAGDSLDPPRFNEPHGVAVAAGKLYIADTNNHRISVADLQTAEVSTLDIDGLEPPEPKSSPPPDTADDLSADVIEVEPRRVAPGEALQFEISLALPEGYKLNKLAPLTYRLKADGEQNLVADEHLAQPQEASGEETVATVSVPLAKASGRATFELSLRYSFCRDGVGGLCKVGTARWLIPVEVTADAAQQTVMLEASEPE